MTISLHKGDLPADVSFGNCVAIDTESMGLNWNRDRLCLVQLSAGDGNAHLVHFEPGNYSAPNLKKLLIDPDVLKLFHFARADLATLFKHLGVMPAPVYCTKVASVLVRTFSDRHSLKDLARDLLSIDLSKEQQTSDWGAPTLSKEQLTYAASDVLYLHKLKAVLDERLARENRTELAKKVMNCLPARAELDVAGWAEVDIFSHKPVRKPD
ncbi:MAG: ribonuclease D [Alphaproteobacteria bacterium]|nr:ribonuclease D [Alphaproteobacteria bacterium]